MVRQIDWQWALDGFKFDLETQVKPKTVDYYYNRVKYFAKWAAETGGIISPVSVTKRQIQTFLHEISTNAPSKKRGRNIDRYRWPFYRSLRRFFNWATKERLIDSNPLADIILKVPKDPPVEPYRAEHVAHIVNILEAELKLAHTQREKMRATRNIAIVYLFLESGIRLSELVNLTCNDINLEAKSLMIRNGKMGKGRMAGFGPKTKKALWRYMAMRVQQQGMDSLWLSEEYRPLTVYGVRSMFRRLKQVAGIESMPGSIHKLRHTFATAYLRQTKDMKGCRILLGHSTMAMTERYTAFIDAEDALKAYANEGPLDWLK